jgi:AraC-like DNA-binding protein
MTLLLKPVPPARHLLRAKDLIDARYREPLDVRALARAAHLSPAHFSREFRRAFGETPHQYLLTRRLERAAALLRNTDYSVAEVCFAVGLQSVGSFTTSFGRALGMSPTAYRAADPPAASRAGLPAARVGRRVGSFREDRYMAAVTSSQAHELEGEKTCCEADQRERLGARPGGGARLLYRARHGGAGRRDGVEMGNFRWLTVGLPGQDDVAWRSCRCRPAGVRRRDARRETLVAGSDGLFFSVADCASGERAVAESSSRRNRPSSPTASTPDSGSVKPDADGQLS